MAITSRELRGALRELDPDSCRVYPFGAPIEFSPGDGKVFELVAERTAASDVRESGEPSPESGADRPGEGGRRSGRPEAEADCGERRG